MNRESSAKIDIEDTRNMKPWSQKTICELEKFRVDLGQDGFLKVYFNDEMIAKPRVKYAPVMKVGHRENWKYINDIPDRKPINFVSIRFQRDSNYYVTFYYGRLHPKTICYNGTTAVNKFTIYVDTKKKRFAFGVSKRYGGYYDSFEYIK